MFPRKLNYDIETRWCHSLEIHFKIGCFSTSHTERKLCSKFCTWPSGSKSRCGAIISATFVAHCLGFSSKALILESLYSNSFCQMQTQVFKKIITIFTAKNNDNIGRKGGREGAFIPFLTRICANISANVGVIPRFVLIHLKYFSFHDFLSFCLLPARLYQRTILLKLKVNLDWTVWRQSIF